MTLTILTIRDLILKFTESNLPGNCNDAGVLFVTAVSIAFVAGFIFLMYRSIKRRSNIAISYFLNIQTTGIFKALWNYFIHFGWIVLGILITLFLFFILAPDYFHYILLVFVLGLFLLFPMKFIFSLVSGRNSLRALFLLFIVTQLLFSGIYYIQINKYGESGNLKNEPGEKEKIGYSQVLLNTFHIALIQECSPAFEDYIAEKEIYEELHNKFFLTLNIQIFISWLYLGVLIASLYHKISKR